MRERERCQSFILLHVDLLFSFFPFRYPLPPFSPSFSSPELPKLLLLLLRIGLASSSLAKNNQYGTQKDDQSWWWMDRRIRLKRGIRRFAY